MQKRKQKTAQLRRNLLFEQVIFKKVTPPPTWL